MAVSLASLRQIHGGPCRGGLSRVVGESDVLSLPVDNDNDVQSAVTPDRHPGVVVLGIGDNPIQGRITAGDIGPGRSAVLAKENPFSLDGHVEAVKIVRVADEIKDATAW